MSQASGAARYFLFLCGPAALGWGLVLFFFWYLVFLPFLILGKSFLLALQIQVPGWRGSPVPGFWITD